MKSRPVFISSTFLDMQQERDILSRRVFPILRDDLNSASVALAEIDLRWGITELMAKDGGAVRLCLDGVAQCAPFIFGMVGSRTGWRPEPDLIEAARPGLPAILPENVGLTAMEIGCAVQCLAGAGAQIPVFLRDDALSDDLGFTPDDPTAMADFRTWLEGCNAVHVIRYGSLEVFEQEATLALQKLMQTPFAPIARPAGRSVEIDRSDALRALTRAASPGRSVLLTGPDGAGLSWIAARWAQAGKIAKVHDGRRSAVADVLPPPRPRTLGRGRKRLQSILRAAMLRVARILPGLAQERSVYDHFEAGFQTSNHASLGCFDGPAPLRETRIVVTREPRLIAEAKASGWSVVHIAPPQPEHCLRFSQDYLKDFGKHLDDTQSALLRQAPWLPNIHLNRIVLDELRRFGVHEELTERLQSLVDLADPADVIAEIARGVQSALPATWAPTLEPMLVALSLSLRGLDERACRSLAALALPESDKHMLPSHLWTPLKLAFGAALHDREGRVDIGTSDVLSYLSDVARSKPAVWRQATSAFQAWLAKAPAHQHAEEAPRFALAVMGPEGLAALLAKPDTARAVLSRGETLLEGWLTRLPMALRQEVACQWEKQCAEGAFSPPQALSLGLMVHDATDKAYGRVLVSHGATGPESASLALACLAQIDADTDRLAALLRDVDWKNAAQSPKTITYALIAMNAVNDGLIDITSAQAADCLRGATRWSREAAPEIAAQLWHQSGQLHAGFARWRAAERCFEHAETLSRATGNGIALAQALERRAAICLEFNAFRQARRSATEAKDIARRLGLLREEEKALHRLIETEQRTANLLEAEKFLQELSVRAEKGVGSEDAAHKAHAALLAAATQRDD